MPSSVSSAPITLVGRESSGHWARLRALCFPSRWALLVCMLVCVVAPASLVAVHIHQNPLFSPVDEAEHFDYVQRIAQGSVPRIGEDLLPSTTHLWECTGRSSPGWAPACGPNATVIAARDNSDDEQYEAQQPPLYYAAVVVMRWPFIHVLQLGELDGTRATGALYLVAGLLLLWLAGCLIGLDWWVVGAGVLLLCVGTNSIYEASLVSNDAASVFTGGVAAVMGAAAWKYPGRIPFWLYGLLGFLVAMIKGSDALGVGVVTLTLAVGTLVQAGGVSALLTLRGWRSWWSGWWPAGGMMLLGAAIGAGGWSITFQALALETPRKVPAFILFGFDRGKPGFSELAGTALTMLNPLGNVALPGEAYRSAWQLQQPGSAFAINMAELTEELTFFLTVVAGFSFLFVRERRWAHWTGVISLLVLWFGGWALGVSIWKTYGYYTVLPGRYGLSIAPLLVLALVGAFEGRWPIRLLWAFSIATFAFSFLYMFD